MGIDSIKQDFLPKYIAIGELKFYQFLIFYALNKMIVIQKESYKGITPDLEFLEYHDASVILYRREGDEVYLKLARCFRKAAHKIYRAMLKKNMIDRNVKFLNLV